MMPGGVDEDSSTPHAAPPGEEAPPAQPDATPSAAAPLATGSRVRIAGISSRPELNGQFAVCLRHLAEKGRWFVRLEEGDTSEISLKEQALTVVGPWSGLCLGAQCGFFGSEAFPVLSAYQSVT